MSTPPKLPGMDGVPGDRYTWLAELARGGLGRIWSAHDETLARDVAIKQVLEPTSETLARFEREARLTARLQHAGVVPVYDVGCSDAGEPFFVMRKVEGRSLAELIATARTTHARLALLPRVLAVAETLAYAHSVGIIHRDLKPANVVVSDHGETLVVDWSLAKFVTEPEPADLAAAARSGEAGLTGIGSLLGTPQFMPPEQAEGRPVCERADVYALGAVIYTVLAGREPFEGARGTALLALVRGASPRPLRELAPDSPPDLLAIVAKAMARSPIDRYQHAGQVGEDLRRFLEGQLVTAHRYSTGALIARWTRKHRATVAAIGISLCLLLGLGIVGVRRIVSERNHAITARQAALTRENTLMLLQAERSLEAEPTTALAWIKRFRSGRDDEWQARAVAEEAIARGVARHVFRTSSVSRAMAAAARAPLAAIGGQDGALELLHLATGLRRRVVTEKTAIRALAITPSGDRIAALHGSGRVNLWSGSGHLVRAADFEPGAGGTLAFSPDATRLALVQGANSITVLAADTLAVETKLTLESRVSGVAFCADGALIVLGKDGRAGVLPAGGNSLRPLRARHPDARVACLADGRRFVTGGVDGEVKSWDREGPATRRLASHGDWVSALAASPDGRYVASGAGDDVVTLAATAGGPARHLVGHEDTIRGVSFTPDGKLLVSASFDSIRFWDPERGTLLRSYPTAAGRPIWWALADEGRFLVGSGGLETRVWPTATAFSRLLSYHQGIVTHLSWEADGARLAVGSRDRRVRLYDFVSDTRWSSPVLDAWPLNVTFLDPTHIVVTTRLITTSVLETAAGGRSRQLLAAKPAAAASAAFARVDPTRRSLAYVEADTLVLQDLATETKLRLAPPVPFATDVDFSADGRFVAACSRLGVAVLWDVATRKALHLQRANEGFDEVAVAPDGRTAALLIRNHRVVLWRVHDGVVREVSPEAGVDGRLTFVGNDAIAYKGAGGTIGVIDVDGRSPRVLRGHRAAITAIATSARHMTIASGDASGFIRLWDLASGKSGVIYAHRGAVDPISFSPSGQLLASGGSEGEVRVWDRATIALSPVEQWDLNQLESHSSTSVDDHGQLNTSSGVVPSRDGSLEDPLHADLEILAKRGDQAAKVRRRGIERDR